jgi:hypothetical protein
MAMSHSNSNYWIMMRRAMAVKPRKVDVSPECVYSITTARLARGFSRSTPGDLAHERVIRTRRGSHKMHAPRLEIDDKERVVRDQAADGPHLGREEVCGRDRAPVRGEKRAPRHRPLRHRAHPVGSEDAGDRGTGDAMAKILQRPLDPAVAPRRILTRHPDAQLVDLGEHARSADASSGRRPFPRDELPVPPQSCRA